MNKSRTVMPVFVVPLKKALNVMGGDWSEEDTQKGCCIANGPFADMGYDITYMEGGDKQCVVEEIPDHEIFRFFGHGVFGPGDIINCIRIEDPTLFVDPWQSLLCCSDIYSACYKLVMLHACGGGETDCFYDSFNTDCFIGWDGSPYTPLVTSWERHFWKLFLDEGKDAQFAVNRAYDLASREAPIPSPALTVCYGNIKYECNVLRQQ